MKELVEAVERLRKSGIKEVIERRLGEFEELGRKSSPELFRELSFCLLTANSSAERCMRIQEEAGDGFLELPREQLEGMLKKHGHRFPSARAGYILEARKNSSLRDVISSAGSGQEAREWLVRNVKGLGYKEASHFLRNIGFKNLAIIDFHIIDLLGRYGLIEKPKSLGRKRYLEIENILKSLSERLGMSLAELDLYLWYMETGKVLK